MHTECRLGKWYFDGDGKARFSALAAFRQLDEPHKQVHESGVAALQYMQSGEGANALDEVNKMEPASNQVLDLSGRLYEKIQNISPVDNGSTDGNDVLF